MRFTYSVSVLVPSSGISVRTRQAGATLCPISSGGDEANCPVLSLAANAAVTSAQMTAALARARETES